MMGHKRRPLMGSAQLRELQENAEYVRDDPSLKPVSLSMAIIAVIVATVSLLGHRAHTEELLIQNQITNGWAHYQAKSSRGHESEMFQDLAIVLNTNSDAVKLALQKKYKDDAARYKTEKNDLFRETRNLENVIKKIKLKANFYDASEVLLEIALVITSITLLSRARLYWYFGLLIAAVGVAVSATGGYLGAV